MSLPSNIPDLSVPATAPADAQDYARCLANAAALVQDFAQHCAPAALEAQLAAAGEEAGIERALDLAESATVQAETLIAEVEHFLSLAQTR